MADIVKNKELECKVGKSKSIRIFSGNIKNFFSSNSKKEVSRGFKTKNSIIHLSCYEFYPEELKNASRFGCTIAFSLSDLLCESGFKRAILLSKMRIALRACRENGVGFVVCTLAENQNQTRSCRELAAFGKAIGMTDIEIKNSDLKLRELFNSISSEEIKRGA